MSARLTLLSAALLGALAVCLGAFAAHGLRDQLSSRMLEVFQTGVTYQFYHVLALFGVGLLLQRQDRPLLRVSAALFLTGMLLFCGSLYLLVATGVHYLGMVTPVGGVLMILGWLTLAGAVFKALPVNS
ncbi:DUF423 domain-containing protein [Marinobacterium sp. YM272]|uniref:DUF423 domain-containing protein n=1 Tax=Marinobacterium sp. YM272 TaxID=3421654 RepID=UPI003D7F35D2